MGPVDQQISAALRAREPLFHRAEHGTRRRTFEAMTDPGFFEVGASGQLYGREQVLDELERRFADTAIEEHLEVDDFRCFTLTENVFLVTYLLDQNGRKSRRSSIWSRSAAGWSVLYHQGTLIGD